MIANDWSPRAHTSNVLCIDEMYRSLASPGRVGYITTRAKDPFVMNPTFVKDLIAALSLYPPDARVTLDIGDGLSQPVLLADTDPDPDELPDGPHLFVEARRCTIEPEPCVPTDDDLRKMQAEVDANPRFHKLRVKELTIFCFGPTDDACDDLALSLIDRAVDADALWELCEPRWAEICEVEELEGEIDNEDEPLRQEETDAIREDFLLWSGGEFPSLDQDDASISLWHNITTYCDKTLDAKFDDRKYLVHQWLENCAAAGTWVVPA